MRLATTLVLVCALAGTAAGDEDHLARARAAADALRFEEAASLLDEAWRAGGADPERARAIAALAGEIAATMGDRAAARRWFVLLAAMDPDAGLDRGTSPKVSAVLDEARASLRGARFDVRLRLDRAGERVQLRAVDPLGAVAAIRVAGGPAGERALVVPWRRADLVVELVDAHGNVLARARRAIGPLPRAAAATPPAWYARWPTWAGVAGGMAVAAGGLALWSASTSRELDALHRDSETHQASEALALERRMQRTAIAAQIAGAGALVAAGVSIYVWRRERRAAIAPMAVEGGGTGAVLEVTF
ncbi:MAG TPA: hypothetical protein VFU21_25475 [Kofleriaceae bacterium]|nr:hypothetical protein [Kofleriaceae bacterium]